MRLIITFNNKNLALPEPWVQPGPANDEIWYTSSDGNIVTPNNTSALPTIVSNTYVDGKGVIKFASDVTSIGEYAFQTRTGLTSITYTGTISQYNSISKASDWHKNVSSSQVVVHCTDGDTPI